MATWAGAVNGTANSKYRVCIDYVWSDNGSGRTYTYNIYLQVTQGNFNGTRVQTNFNGILTVSGAGVYGRTGNKTANVGYGGTFNPGTYEAYYAGYSTKQYHATVSGSESVPRPTHTVSYNANGGSGAPGSQTKTWGYVLTLSSTKPTRSGYNFLGWGTSASATTASYQPGGQYTADQNITLYAVWQVATKVTFDIPAFSYSVKSTSDLLVTVDSLGKTNVPYTPVTVSENANTNFYYKIYDITRTYCTDTYGPFTGTGISNGSQTGDGAKNLIISSRVMLNTLQNLETTSKASFYVDISTGANTFAEAITTTQRFDVTLTNFAYLKLGEYKGIQLEGYRDSSNNGQATICVEYPACYMTTTKKPTISTVKINGTSYSIPNNNITVSIGTGSTSNVFVIRITGNTSVIPTSSGVNVSISLTDNISSVVLHSRIPAVGKDNITIYDNYNNTYPNACKCNEFIEGSAFGFSRGGKCMAGEFIEDDGGVVINSDGKEMHFGQLIEE